MEQTATGEFDIQFTAIDTAAPTVGSMAISKTYKGDLTGDGTGQLLAVRTPVEDSAGYVAMERVFGTLDGRTGTFALQHSGTMDKGAQTQSVTVVPDSGTDDLTGLAGSMTIRAEGAKHVYTLRYTLPARA
ncbi:MAG: DUF3224 domain-containing protein [Novosphingobium sp.]